MSQPCFSRDPGRLKFASTEVVVVCPVAKVQNRSHPNRQHSCHFMAAELDVFCLKRLGG